MEIPSPAVVRKIPWLLIFGSLCLVIQQQQSGLIVVKETAALGFETAYGVG
jgi:hypothetical protein